MSRLTYAEKAKQAVKKCYSDLMKVLPINDLVEHFFSRNLLSFDQKRKIDGLTLRKEKIAYFLDEILISGLSVGSTEHFDNMVTMMKESDDILANRSAERLTDVLDDSTSTTTASNSTGGSSSNPSTIDTGINL